MAGIRDSFDQAVSSFKGLSPVQKALAAAVALGLLVAVISLVVRSGGEERYRVLFSNLTVEDAAAVVEKLKEQRVPYRLEREGTVISVPAGRVYEVRLALAGEGLPRGSGVGFEIFDKQSFGTTDFVQRLNYQRALQGELARTIAQFQQVRSARVHIAEPKESVFIEEERPPSASVAVQLRGRQKLSGGQIKAIVNLVAAAVPGLTPEHITVVDTNGRLLYRGEGEEEGAVTAGRLEYRFRLEEALRRKVETLLEEVVGAGRARARVTAEIDFDRVQLTEEVYDPEGQVVRSEQLTTEEEFQGADQAKGIPGVKGELATYAGKEEGGGPLGGTHRRNSTTRNYEISKKVRQVVGGGGGVRRLSVAVMVDGTYERQRDDKGATVMRFQPRSKEELADLAKIVKNAIGYDPERGDQVEVVCMPFAGSQVVEPAPTLAEKWGALVDKLVMAVDSGVIVNPVTASGQIEGGMTQALGYAVCEEMAYDEAGCPRERSFRDYHIFRAHEMPELETIFVETFEPSHPFGVKAVAEIPMDGVAPAVANAILDACGAVIDANPATPEKVWRALRSAQDSTQPGQV